MKKTPVSTTAKVSAELIQEIIEASLAMDDNAEVAKCEKVSWLGNKLFKTHISGAENIPDAPVLYIANHATMAMDVSVVLPALIRASGRFVRGMNDEMFYRNKTVRAFMLQSGGVMGNPDIGSALFEAGKDILLFPGGAHEANKDLDKRYTLQWKKRTGFVRLAAKHGVSIVPVAVVGPDEWYGRYMDREDISKSWVGGIMRRMGASEKFMQSDKLSPIPKGLFGTLIPRPQPSFIHIGEPISTKEFKGKAISQQHQDHIRDLTKASLEYSLSKMLLKQAQIRDKVGVI